MAMVAACSWCTQMISVNPRRVIASNVTAPMNSRAERVSTTSTSAPPCANSRASHAVL